MPSSMEGKTALITGAGSGIGRATAHKLHTLGANLILIDINPSSLHQVETELTPNSSSNQSQHHQYHTCDISSPTACNNLLATLTTSQPLTINYLFNNAGINPTTMPITSTPDTYFTKLINTNLRGTFNMTRACIPHMPSSSNSAAIVNMTSMCGLKGYSGFSVYCATKFAIVGFTKALAVELGPRGIRVNAVAPGPTDTPTMVGNVEGEEKNEEMVKGVALGRLGRPEEVADVVGFLFGDEARFVNGGVVEVTGGGWFDLFIIVILILGLGLVVE